MLPNLCSPTASLNLSQTADTSPEQHCTSLPLPTGKDVPTLSALQTPSKEVTPSTGRAAFRVTSCPGPSAAPAVQLLHGEKTKQMKDPLFSFSFFGQGRREEPKGCCSYHTNNLKKLQLERRGEEGRRPAETIQCRIYDCKNLWLSIGCSHVNIY